MNKVRDFYYLTKPGIVRGNAITAAAGFFLASKGDIDWDLLLAMLSGLCLIIAGSCVFNNYLDRDIDSRMSRTKKRALVSGAVSERSALIYASLLGFIGAFILASFTNLLAWGIALLGMFSYVVVYGIGKRKTVWGTVIGSISGAIPPVVGYTAVTDSFNLVALLLFLTIVFWQMPHFYAIAMFRLKDYKAARIPVLPAVKGMVATKRQTIGYIYGFTATSAALGIVGNTGNLYLAGTLLLGGAWLYLSVKGFGAEDDVKWARKMFGFSLIVMMGWSLLISIDSFIS